MMWHNIHIFVCTQSLYMCTCVSKYMYMCMYTVQLCVYICFQRYIFSREDMLLELGYILKSAGALSDVSPKVINYFLINELSITGNL